MVADALSRRDSEADLSVAALSAPSFPLFDDMRNEQYDDPTMKLA